MARQVLPWVGAAVGSIWGQPQLGFMIGSLVGNAIDPQVIEGPKLGEGQNNRASEGGYRPIVLGKGAVGVCMIHEGPIKKRTIRHRQSKGGGPVTTEERAYRTMAFALGESAYPDTGVQLLRLWIDNKLRYDVTPTSQIKAESQEFAQQFTFYPGDEEQEPDPDLEAFLGAGNVPAYRGGAPYIVLPDWDVTDSRGMAPQIRAELATTLASEPATTIAAGMASSAPGSDFTSVSATGAAFGSPSSGSALWMQALAYPRIFGWNNGANCWISDDFGATKLNVGNVDGYGGPHVPAYYDGVLLIPGALDGIFRSVDEGETISLVPGSPRSTCIAMVQGVSISVYDPSRVDVSVDGGLTWISGGDTGLYVGAPVGSRTTTDNLAIFGGTSWEDEQKPAVSITSNGHSFQRKILSSSSGTTVTAICAAREGSTWRIVLTTDAGEVFSTTDLFENVQVIDQSFVALDIAHNGKNFVMVSGGSGEPRIVYTPDGISLHAASHGYGGAMLSVVATGQSIVEAGKISLSSVVSWIHERANIPASKYNVTQLTDMVEGVVFADSYTCADAIRSQMGQYFFDAGEFDAGTGYRINYVKRGGAASVTLTDADVVDGPDDWEREDSYERPRALHVAYQNPVADYGAPNITIKRTSPDVLVVGERSVAVPNVYSDVDEITRRADIMLTVVYTEIAGTYEVVLPIRWLELAPTDCIGFSIRGRTRRLRMTDWRFSPDGTIRTKWMSDRQSAYTSNVTGLPVVPTSPPPPSIVGPTVSAVLDIPALVDSADSLHLVVAASGQSPAWYGAQHQVKGPSDADFATAAQFSAPTTIMGVLQADVSDASEHFTDTTNVVRVQLYSDDELVTYTQQQFLSENGAFALAWDDDGTRRWEICQYRDAVKVGEREWELTTLLRGRLNTETAEHPTGSMFVLLDAGIRMIPAQSAWLDETLTHRAVSNGQLPDQAAQYTQEYTGESQREWPVAHVFASLNGDTLEAAWVPRHRFGTDDHPVRSANWDGYRVTATDGVNTLTADTTADGHSFDVTGWSSPITITVSQLNRFTGEGPSVTESIEV